MKDGDSKYSSGQVNNETVKELYISAITYIGRRYRIHTDLNYKQGTVREVKHLLDIMMQECYHV